jgi:anti-sigma B factor antagonist
LARNVIENITETATVKREMKMEITTSAKNDVLLVTLNGRLDAVTAADFDQKINSLLTEGASSLVLNLHGLEYISSAGLRSILVTGKKLKSSNGGFALVGLRGVVKEVFEVSGFYSIFKIFESEEEALRRSA